MKVWGQTGIELSTPGSAVKHASVARHLINCATRPGSGGGGGGGGGFRVVTGIIVGTTKVMIKD